MKTASVHESCTPTESAAAPRVTTVRIPASLCKPAQSWTEFYGVRRAIAVIDTQAKFLRRAGDKESAKQLWFVADALRKTIAKPVATAEAVSLRWPLASGQAAACAVSAQDE